MTTMDTCVKNRGTFSNLQILHPAAFCFKDEGFLAEHPLICHHQGMFGCLESAKKMKEKGAEKKRETGELKASPKIYYEVIDVHFLQTEAYIC